jgi:hypothetical protein
MTYTTAELAERCDVTYETVRRWSKQWQVPEQIHHTDADAKVARAWAVIDCIGDPHCKTPNALLLRTLAETAIRYRPRRWLALSAVGASMHDTAADAVKAWEDHGHVFVRLIDLEPAA